MCVHMHDMYDARLPASRLKPCRAPGLDSHFAPWPGLHHMHVTCAVLLHRAGILNTIGGAYCIKAKSAIAAQDQNGGAATTARVRVAVTSI